MSASSDAALFLVAYLAGTALGLPVGVALNLAAGALFGFLPGFLLSLAAATLGCTLAMLLSRHFFRDLAQRRTRRFDRLGAYPLFVLRLAPIVPSSAINAAYGLSQFPTSRFAVVSALGLAPLIALYVHAGTRLSAASTPGDLFTWPILLALAVLALAPLAARRWR